MNKYINMLDESYAFWQAWECPPESKLEYLGSIVFNFTTYDSEMESIFAKKMIEVLKHILNKSISTYIVDYENYVNYISMVNSPFLLDKLNWGTSIRMAWFDIDKEIEIDDILKIDKDDFEQFIKELLIWKDIEEIK